MVVGNGECCSEFWIRTIISSSSDSLLKRLSQDDYHPRYPKMTTIFKSWCHRQHLMITRLECLLVLFSLFLPQLASFFFRLFSPPLWVVRIGCDTCFLDILYKSQLSFSILLMNKPGITLFSESAQQSMFSISRLKRGLKRPHFRSCHLNHFIFHKSMSRAWRMSNLILELEHLKRFVSNSTPTSKTGLCQAWESCSAVVALKQHNQCS